MTKSNVANVSHLQLIMNQTNVAIKVKYGYCNIF